MTVGVCDVPEFMLMREMTRVCILYKHNHYYVHTINFFPLSCASTSLIGSVAMSADGCITEKKMLFDSLN